MEHFLGKQLLLNCIRETYIYFDRYQDIFSNSLLLLEGTLCQAGTGKGEGGGVAKFSIIGCSHPGQFQCEVFTYNV